MKSRFFPKTDEVVLSTITALIVGGLLYQGFASWMNEDRQHAIFHKNPAVSTKK